MTIRNAIRTILFAALTAPILVTTSSGEPAIDLSGRIVIDGFSTEFTADENLFQPTPGGGPEESTVDSQWGLFNDLNQIKITWDANFLYVAVDAYIFDNNTMLFFDTLPLPDGTNPGLRSLSQVNSWRRAVSFDNDFYPDLFLATWDRNTTPQMWFFTGPNQVAQVPQGSFPTVATFSRDLPDRSMEAAIPWDVFFLGAGVQEFVPAYGDTVYQLPFEDAEIRIAGWITTGADGLGGPDSAPDNLSGHQVDAAVPVVLDNYIRLRIDRFDADGNPNPDGVPDFNVPVRTPTTPDLTQEEYDDIVDQFFFVAPPLRGVTLEIADLEFAPSAIAPDLGDALEFRFSVTPRIEDPRIRAARQVSFSAEVFDLNGALVRTLYRDQPFTLDALEAEETPPSNRFDGRDDRGQIVDGGIYVLRVVLEPGVDQARKALVVVR